MTPACRFLKQHNVNFSVHHYQTDFNANHDNYGQAVAEELEVEANRLFKTLIICLNGNAKSLAVCIAPSSETVNLKQAAKCFNAKSATMADAEIAQKTTGYVIGGISPFGQRKVLPTAVDESCTNFETIYTSGGKRGLQIEFPTSALMSLLNANVFPLCD
ncbi:Cys-tRNA(Pro) deacylase [Reinekea thalattae]|uniref:Cys-tRNA(Pro)/Cys-tRNA(Cys) deacylase n=1 Tax=Reinekea thalattae TaxID=2593301 RepID=A0A5C8ZD62_9GAMM|nr:Cys-tRNA(Pro) deacylase [Reinekea thalattae]TXR54856.1 Cys-tRNA(Pro) deacylase [Reinekea thalattae]